MYKRKRTCQGKKYITKKMKYTYTNPLQQGIRNVTKGVDTVILPTSSPVITSMNNNDNVIPLNLIQAGTGSWNRIGRIINMKSLRLRIKAICRYTATSASLARQLRILVLYDRQPNGNLPIKSEVVQYKTQAGTETGTWNGFLSYDNMQRFRILRDETISFDYPASRLFNDTGVPSAPQVTIEKVADMYIKLPNLVTNYKSETSPATISDISTGALYLIMLTDSNIDDAPSILVEESYARLRYIDQ